MLIRSILRLFFRCLYHPLAFSYDWVAAAVSLGHWNEWGRAALDHLHGPRLLELGHGPGHLQPVLRELGFWTAGLDESAQMSRMAARRLRSNGFAEVRLVRSMAQAIPFAAESFDSIVSVFPSEYIFDAATLGEARRVLVPGGRLVVLPAAWPANRLLGWLFQITRQAPPLTLDIIRERFRQPLMDAGFQVQIETRALQSGVVLMGVATKEPH